jgi:hypothetical protein
MSENEIQSRVIEIPPVIQGYLLTIWNNNGSEILYNVSLPTGTIVKVTNTGTEGWYTYDSDGEFLGFAILPNRTSPTYTSGDSITIPSSGLTLYLVSYEWDKVEYESVKVEYNGKELGTVTKGSPLTLSCKDKLMRTNVTITKI